VLVTIEEPHMYNADDAIARVDSYIVSVEGAGDQIGERRLVRIEDVARSAATASLLDSNGEKVESTPSGRRRGRRGGRRRSRARTGNDG
jgi:ribonuclease G